MTGDDLTDREEEILVLLAKGVATQTIADRLWISVRTARNHIQSILTKLGVHNRLAAVHAWKTHRTDYSARVLAYCRRAQIPLTELQIALIISVFQVKEVTCDGSSHVFPTQEDGAAWACLCGEIRVVEAS